MTLPMYSTKRVFHRLVLPVLSMLCLAAALPERLDAQCTLSPLPCPAGLALPPGTLPPCSFEPNPPGASRANTNLSSGKQSDLVIYNAAGGSPRMLMLESFGYSVLDLSNPVSPSALVYDNMGLSGEVPTVGDGQSDVASIAVSSDGARLAISMNGNATRADGSVAAVASGTSFNRVTGGFVPRSAGGTVVQHVGNRYLAYSILSSSNITPGALSVADITNIPGPFAATNVSSEHVGPGGIFLTLAGNNVLYLNQGTIRIYDASSPGPVGNVSGNFGLTTLSSTDFAGRVPTSLSAAMDPTDSTRLWVLAELSSPLSWALVSVKGGVKTVSPQTFVVPQPAGESWVAGGVSALTTNGNGGLFALMWAKKFGSPVLYRLFSTSVQGWGTTVGQFDVDSNSNPAFALNFSMRGLPGAGTALYAYVATGNSAYVLPMSCVSVDAPAVASMAVTSQAGAALADGATVFLGDTISITPAINPPTSLQPLTGFGWNFDFDFHASEETNTSPHISVNDDAAFGSGAAPPSLVTVVGPCDYRVANTTPLSGAGCWSSVTTNAASGGPDFASASPAPGTTVPLKFAFEANNSLGSAGLSTFTLNWKVPGIRLASAQILSGNPVVSGADGHPSPTGFNWYFGSTPGAPATEPMTQDTLCTGPSCNHVFLQGKGTYNVFFSAPYANGFATPDFVQGTSVPLNVTVTDVVPTFLVNGSSGPPVTLLIGSTFNVTNHSQAGPSVAGIAYTYSLCQDLTGLALPCTNYLPLTFVGTVASVTTPSSPIGVWYLRIHVNYTGGDPGLDWLPTIPSVTDPKAFPLVVSNVIPQIHVLINGADPCAPGPGANCTTVDAFTGDALTAKSFVLGAPDSNSAISWGFPGASPASASTPTAAFSYATGGTYTITLNGYGSPVTIPARITQRTTPSQPLSVSALASPNPAALNAAVNFTCSAAGGSGSGFTYAWSGAVTGTTAQMAQSFSAASTYSATCTVHDSANNVNSRTASVVVTSGTSGCTSSDFHISVGGASSFPNGGFQVAAGDVVTFVPAANYSTYSWSFGDGSAPDTTQIPTHVYTSPGRYTVSLTADGSCTRSYPIVVTGTGGGGPSIACQTVGFSILDGTTNLPACGPFGCAEVTGQPVLFVPTASTTVTSWNFGDGSTSTTNPGTHTYAGGGNFTVTLTAGSCTTTNKITISGPTALSGEFRVKYSDASAFDATQVASGKAVTFLPTDTADAYTWDFGDGTSPATGRTPGHAYVTPGTASVVYTATLSVTRGTGTSAQQASTSQTFTVLPPTEAPRWFAAGMAYVQGTIPGTVWQSDVTILNPDPTSSGTYSVAFLDALHPVDPASLDWKTINLEKEQSVSLPNVLGTFFGQPLGSFGSLLVRGDVAPVPPVITSRTYNGGDPAKGTFGLSVPSTRPSSGLTPDAVLSQQLLIGLRDDDTAYTNIGLMNVTTDWSHARLTFFDRSGGTTLGQMDVDVPPYGVAQFTRPLAAPQPNGVGFPDPVNVFSVKVTVLSGGAVFPYATVIDRKSTDAIVVTASDRPSSTYRMPGMIRLQGANGTVWRSRFYIANPSATSRQATLSYSYVPCDETGHCEDRGPSLEADLTLGPGETLFTDDFPKTWLSFFGITASDATAYQASYIDVTPTVDDPNQEPLLVLGETFNDGPAGPVGLQLPGFTDSDAASKTGATRRLLLTGLISNASFRTNVALFLQSGASGTCTVHVLSDAGAELAHQDIAFGGSTTFVQLNDSGLFGSISGNKDRLTVVVDTFEGSPVSVYATIVDNVSGDATFLKAQPAP